MIDAAVAPMACRWAWADIDDAALLLLDALQPLAHWSGCYVRSAHTTASGSFF